MLIQETIRELVLPQAATKIWPGWEMGTLTASYTEGAVYDIHTNDAHHPCHASAIISVFPAKEAYPSVQAEKEALDRLHMLASQEGHVPDPLRSCNGILRPAERLYGMYTQDGRTAGSWSIIRTEKVVPVDHYLKTHDVDRAAVVALMIQMAQTLAEIHEAGIIHGSLRMERLFVAEDGTMRIGGTASAKHYDNDTISSGLGEKDVYLLCSAMRWMVDRVEVPDGILDILLKGTSATPSDRYETALALRNDLEKVAATIETTKAAPVKKKKPVWIAIAIAALLLITFATQCGRGKRSRSSVSDPAAVTEKTTSAEAEDGGAVEGSVEMVDEPAATEDAPIESEAATGIAKVTVTSCHVRSTPDKDDAGNIVATLTHGSYVRLTAKTGDWYAVDYAGGTGYIYSSMLTVEDSGESGAPKKGHVTATVCNLRSSPDRQSSSNIMQTLSQGTAFTSYIHSGEWYFVELENGTMGFISDTVSTLDQ